MTPPSVAWKGLEPAALLPLARKSQRDGKGNFSPRVPVVSSTGTPLMPTHQARARQLLKSGKAKKRFSNTIFYLQLIERESGNIQQISCGIDPGSKREGFTVKSDKNTFINILSDAVTTVKDKLEVRKNMRRSRRFRKTPCRKNKTNRKRGSFIPPSIKSRWDAKLRIINILRRLYPISDYIVEDIKAKTKEGKKKWNISFSPLETGKKYFYEEVSKLGKLTLKQGYETAEIRNNLGLVKTKNKLENTFSAHNVDSWVLANSIFGNQKDSENKNLVRFVPIEFHRRQLHMLQFAKGGIRKRYGGTMSLGIQKGMVCKVDNNGRYYYGYVGGNKDRRLSVHNIEDGKRVSTNTKISKVKKNISNQMEGAIPTLPSSPLPSKAWQGVYLHVLMKNIKYFKSKKSISDNTYNVLINTSKYLGVHLINEMP